MDNRRGGGKYAAPQNHDAQEGPNMAMEGVQVVRVGSADVQRAERSAQRQVWYTVTNAVRTAANRRA